jgi:hypothetical protein
MGTHVSHFHICKRKNRQDIPKLLTKGHVHPQTFEKVNLVLELLCFTSVTSSVLSSTSLAIPSQADPAGSLALRSHDGTSYKILCSAPFPPRRLRNDDERAGAAPACPSSTSTAASLLSVPTSPWAAPAMVLRRRS